MNAPRSARSAPFVQDAPAGTYWWCACGRSRQQPFCDGSHKGTAFAPLKLELAAPQRVAWCGCKRTADAPFCDGSHQRAV